VPKNEPSVPVEFIEEIILSLRGQRVMLDRDLAALYRVSTNSSITVALEHGYASENPVLGAKTASGTFLARGRSRRGRGLGRSRHRGCFQPPPRVGEEEVRR